MYSNYQTELRLSTPDAYEPNDTIEEARCISSQLMDTFTLHDTNDVDYYYFHIEDVNTLYTFYRGRNHTNHFTHVQLWDVDAATLLQDMPAEALELFQYQFTTPGKYFLNVSETQEPRSYGVYVEEPLGVCE